MGTHVGDIIMSLIYRVRQIRKILDISIMPLVAINPTVFCTPKIHSVASLGFLKDATVESLNAR